jgi:peptidoglycan/LPS O-acetylase OafA/YrhL
MPAREPSTERMGVPLRHNKVGTTIASGSPQLVGRPRTERKIPVAADAATTRSRVEILDLLRALAVLAVVVFHYSFRGAAGDEGFTEISLPALVPFAKYGFLGVQLFFVISGFVIAYSTEHRTAVEFCIARIARIYPGFIVCMTLTFLMTLAAGAPHFEAGVRQWLANILIVAPAFKQPFMDGAYWSLVDGI